MGIRVGARLGPVSVSTRLTSSDAEPYIKALGAAILVGLVLLAVLTISPLLAAAGAIATLRRGSTWSHRTGAVILSMVALVLAFQVWPREYTEFWAKRSVPSLSGSLGEASARLAAAGFAPARVSRLRTSDGAVGPGCLVLNQNPRADKQFDRRHHVEIQVECHAATFTAVVVSAKWDNKVTLRSAQTGWSGTVALAQVTDYPVENACVGMPPTKDELAVLRRLLPAGETVRVLRQSAAADSEVYVFRSSDSSPVNASLISSGLWARETLKHTKTRADATMEPILVKSETAGRRRADYLCHSW